MLGGEIDGKNNVNLVWYIGNFNFFLGRNGAENYFKFTKGRDIERFMRWKRNLRFDSSGIF